MLVFLNRGLSTILSAIFLFFNEGVHSKKSPPLYKYSYCTVSNIISSWCQYEALKYVSFPTQVNNLTIKNLKYVFILLINVFFIFLPLGIGKNV